MWFASCSHNFYFCRRDRTFVITYGGNCGGITLLDLTVSLPAQEPCYKCLPPILPQLKRLQDEMPGVGTYARHFGAWDFAFQKMFANELDRARQSVHERICEHVPQVLTYADFLVLNEKLSLSIQPAVPIPHGYTTYWPFRPDERHVIDLTLGVLLSEPKESEILGYVALPRWLAGTRTFRFSSGSVRTELFGRSDLDFLEQILDAKETFDGQPA